MYIYSHTNLLQHDYQMFKEWQKVKTNEYNVELGKLKEKLTLQKELINVQGQASEYRQQKQDSLQIKVITGFTQQHQQKHSIIFTHIYYYYLINYEIYFHNRIIFTKYPLYLTQSVVNYYMYFSIR